MRSYIPHYRVQIVRERTTIMEDFSKKIHGPADVAAVFDAAFPGRDRELFVALMLNTQHKVIGTYNISRGTLDTSLVHPREVFKEAIIKGIAAIILVHNHPSGDANPSPEDREVTRRMREAGNVVGISVLDHVIVGDGTGARFSFVESGLIPF